MTAYYITTTTIFFLLCLIWQKKTWFNFFIKSAFFGLGVWGLILSLIALGILVRS